MRKIKKLYVALLQKATVKNDGTLPEPPKGYVRAHNITNKGEVLTRLFRLASAKKVIEREDIGKVSIFHQDGDNYAYVHDLNIYIFAGKAKEKPIETVVNAINNAPERMYRDIADQIDNAPKPFSKVITNDTVKKIKELSKLLHTTPRSLTDALIKTRDGIVTVSDGEVTIVSSKKLDIPDFDGMSVMEFRSVKNEMYISGEDGHFSNGLETIESGLDFDQVKTVDHTHTDLVIDDITPDLLKTIQTVQRSVAKNNPKYELNGILLDVENGEAVAVGTDTRRLTISKEFNVKGKDGQYIILPKHISKNTKLIKIGVGGAGNGTTYSETDDYVMYSKNISGRYPDYKRIIPQANTHSFRVKARELGKLLKDEKEAVFTLHPDRIVVSKLEEYGDALEAGEVIGSIGTNKTSAKGEVIGFNTKYILDAIKDEDEIMLNFNEPERPFTVKSADQLTIIMPIVLVSREEVRQKKEEREERERQKEAEHIAFEKQREAREIEERIVEEGVAYDFLNTLEPKRRGQAKKVLLKQIRSDGEIMERKDWVKKFVDKGYKPLFKEYKEWSKRKGENINKSSWALTGDDNLWFEITKTEAQFAQFLIDGTTLDSIEAKESILKPNKPVNVGDIAITIESEKGTMRRGIDHNGKEWATELKDDYGYFNLTTGSDGDEIDVYINSDIEVNEIKTKQVFYLKQRTGRGEFDEDKFILGADSLKDAKRIYYRNYDDGYVNSGSWHEVSFGNLQKRLDRLTSIYQKRALND